MQQHPVPQNITGFEFKLIGFLTLRQFGYLAAAGIFDFILFSAKLPFIVALIIAVPISLFALALAFLPINDMPFERWIAAFFKTIYSPNTRVWHREPKTIGFLEPQFSIYLKQQADTSEPRILSDPTKLNRYLQGHKKQKTKSLSDLDEERRLAQLNLTPIAPEKQVFTASNLQPREGEASLNTGQGEVRFQRMEQVVESTKQRSSEGGS